MAEASWAPLVILTAAETVVVARLPLTAVAEKMAVPITPLALKM